MPDAPIKFSAAAGTVLIAVFAAVICLPILDTKLHLAPAIELQENRVPADFPAWDGKPATLDKFPAGFEAWFNDHFGFRNLLVRWDALLRTCWLRDSPVSTVTIGKNGWLFFTNDGFTDYRRGRVRQPKEVGEAWRRNFESKQKFFAKRGIRYIIL